MLRTCDLLSYLPLDKWRKSKEIKNGYLFLKSVFDTIAKTNNFIGHEAYGRL